MMLDCDRFTQSHIHHATQVAEGQLADELVQGHYDEVEHSCRVGIDVDQACPAPLLPDSAMRCQLGSLLPLPM